MRAWRYLTAGCIEGGPEFFPACFADQSKFIREAWRRQSGCLTVRIPRVFNSRAKHHSMLIVKRGSRPLMIRSPVSVRSVLSSRFRSPDGSQKSVLGPKLQSYQSSSLTEEPIEFLVELTVPRQYCPPPSRPVHLAGRRSGSKRRVAPTVLLGRFRTD